MSSRPSPSYNKHLTKESDCSREEWQARKDMAALFRLVAHYGMQDLDNGGIGARVPGEPDHYLTYPYGMFWEEAKASDFVKIDKHGKPLDPNGPWLNDGVVNLCVWIFGARPEVNFYVHGHCEEIMAVGSIKEGLLPLSQPAVYLGHMVSFIDYEFSEDEAFGKHFVKTLGDKQLMISRNHGYYSLGVIPSAAFFRAYYLRQACSAQIRAMSMGRELHQISKEEVAKHQQAMYSSEDYNYDGKTEWPGLMRIVEKKYPDYKH